MFITTLMQTECYFINHFFGKNETIKKTKKTIVKKIENMGNAESQRKVNPLKTPLVQEYKQMKSIKDINQKYDIHLNATLYDEMDTVNVFNSVASMNVETTDLDMMNKLNI